MKKLCKYEEMFLGTFKKVINRHFSESQYSLDGYKEEAVCLESTECN